MDYKKPLDIEQQLAYLTEHKNVKITNFDSAKASLTTYNYFNHITPFKHEFADRVPNTRFECVKSIQGRYSYSKITDFTSYQNSFIDERKKYSGLYNGIHKFEVVYKSLITNLFLVKHNVINSTIATNVLEIYKNRIDHLVIHTMGGEEEKEVRRNQMKKVFDNIIRQVNGYTRKNIIDPTKIDFVDPLNIYLIFDRLNLSQINTIYFCMRKEDRFEIYSKLKDLNVNLGAKDHVDFLKRVFNLVSIRNSIMHFNSITILLKYSDYKKKKYRTRNSIEDYESIMRSLNFINNNMEFHSL